jgi:hypothetical protein
MTTKIDNRQQLYCATRIHPSDNHHSHAYRTAYDEPHNDYVYQPEWVDFIVNFLQISGAQPSDLRKRHKDEQFMECGEFEI